MSLKIMVVDDEALTLRVMRPAVIPLGHQIFALEDSHDASERVKQQRFDAIFISTGMPHVDGLELTRQIRNSQLNHDTAIVILSPTNDIQTLRDAFSAGATLVLTKPVVPAQIIPMLTAMDRPGWKDQRSAARLPLFTQVTCRWNEQQFSLRSLNISETGMLLEPPIEAEVGQEVSLQFEIGEARAPLVASARIVRKEGSERMGVEFAGLAPETQNAIQLYILGRLRGAARSPEALHTRPPRLFHRND